MENGEEEIYQTSEGGYISISSQTVKSSDLNSNTIEDSGRFSEINENERSLGELEEELSYLKSLPDEKGYLKRNIRDLEKKIDEFKQRQNFTQYHQIPPKK